MKRAQVDDTTAAINYNVRWLRPNPVIKLSHVAGPIGSKQLFWTGYGSSSVSKASKELL